MINDPNSFVELLKEKYESPYAPGIRDDDFDSITQTGLEEHGLPFNIGDPAIDALDKMIKDVFNDIVQSQNPTVSELVLKHIAIGVMQTGDVNAFIAKGGDDVFGIIMNSGLMVLLNKAIKLWVGANDVKNITYCNRKQVELLTTDDVHEMLQELFDYYKSSGIPRGPMIKLGGQSESTYGMALHLAEAFIVCHELGHYLNGDLDDKDCFTPIPVIPNAYKYREGSNHAKEFKADETGYRLLNNYIDSKYPDVPTEFRLFSLSCIIDLIGVLSEGESISHPEPMERSINIVRDYYGDEKANEWRKTYENPTSS